jgi:hypothetical protein
MTTFISRRIWSIIGKETLRRLVSGINQIIDVVAGYQEIQFPCDVHKRTTFIYEIKLTMCSDYTAPDNEKFKIIIQYLEVIHFLWDYEILE